MATEYPKNLYRWGENGEKLSKLFQTESAVEAGWVCHDDLGEFGAAPAKAAPDEVAAKIADAERRVAAAETEKAALEGDPAPQRPRRRRNAGE